jgi:hypothetical protein
MAALVRIPMIKSGISATRIGGIATIAAILAMSFMSVSFASSGPKAEFLVSINIRCFNPSFCGSSYAQTVGATAYWGGKMVTSISIVGYNSNGKVAIKVNQIWTGTWKVGGDGNFVLSGRNMTTIVTGSHAQTINSRFSNYDTGTPAHPINLDCAQFLGVSCPKGVFASETVAKA